MPDLLEAIPARRPDLLLKPFDQTGRCVVKDPRTGAFFQLGAEESFLLSCLDGKQTPQSVCLAFEAKFEQELSLDDYYGFLEDARDQGFLQEDESKAGFGLDSASCRDEVLLALYDWPVPGAPPEPFSPPVETPNAQPATPQNILFFRYTLFDPDRLFNWLEPRLWFVWTWTFLLVSSAVAAAAFAVIWLGRQELVAQLPRSVAWQLIAFTLFVSIVVTLLHEFAHGLTCKHYGGEVHEVGVLVMYFMPCFFCNVSDAWLIPDKAKRLLVTLAGGYCDLLLWAFGVFVWRVTLPGTWINFMAWIMISVCGVRVILNFNPLIKLDGYYLLSDVTGIVNLYQRGRVSLMAWVRWFLWGAPLSPADLSGRFVLVYGLLSWLLSVLLVGLFLLGMVQFLGEKLGITGQALGACLGFVSVRRLFQGIALGEVRQMIVSRRKRTATWALILAAVSFILCAVPVSERTGGQFTIRPSKRFELRAPIAGFLREAHFDEGSKVSPGAPLARLDVPDLNSQIERKRAEIRESQSRLNLLKVGPRPEELAEERLRVERAKTWRDLAKRDLDRAIETLRAELIDLDQLIRQHQIERNNAADLLARDKALFARQVLQLQALKESEKTWQVFEAQLRQAEAKKTAREAEGTLKSEAELARRESELADLQAKLRLLEAGTRPEEIDAETAHLARLNEELSYLEALSNKLSLFAPFSGIVVTPRLKEKVGRYYKEGDLICEVESLSTLEAEIVVPEQDALRLKTGQPVQLKARALPFHSFESTVARIASSTVRAPGADSSAQNDADAGSTPAKLVVYSEMDGLDLGLETGMTGYARITIGNRTMGAILWDRVLRVLRTEFWW